MEWLLGLLALTAAAALAVWFIRFSGGPPHMTTNTTRPIRKAHPATPTAEEVGFSVWCFERDAWKLSEDRSAAGCVPGAPPAEAGQYAGHCVRVTSVRQRGG